MRPARIEPGPGQESVWDYPRPPRAEPTTNSITVAYKDTLIAETNRAIRVIETSQPPAFYIPIDDVKIEHLTPSIARSFCEWKGQASYYDLNRDLVDHGGQLDQVAWRYPKPNPEFETLVDHLAFYAQKLTCTLDGEHVDPNEGSFYGGWVTSKVVGPFKGGPGSAWW